MHLSALEDLNFSVSVHHLSLKLDKYIVWKWKLQYPCGLYSQTNMCNMKTSKKVTTVFKTVISACLDYHKHINVLYD